VSSTDWKEIELRDLGHWGSGGTPSRSNPAYYNGNIPWLKIGDLSDGIVQSSEECISQDGFDNSSAKMVPPGAVLIAMYGSIGKLGITRIPVATNQAIAYCKPYPKLARPEFLFYWLLSKRSDLIALGKGGTQQNISQTVIKQLTIKVPTLDQQSLIIAELDKQLSRLDETVTTLKGIQAKLKQARASILKAAVEGRLVETEAELARIENRKYEHARDLIAASLKLREQQHESVQQTQDRKRTYRKPTSVSYILSQDASLLPPGWAYASTEEVTSGNPYSLAIGPFGSNLKVSDYKDRGVPLVFVRNVRSNIFSLDNAVFVSQEKANELKAHAAEPGDLLITKMGDPPGDSAIYPSGLPRPIITADVIKLKPSDRFAVQYLLYATKSSFFRLQIQLATKGVAQKKVSLERFSKIYFPIPPYAEQVRIVNEIDRRFSVLDQVEATVHTSLARCGKLRQAILKRAFGG
jgi:type I restriction enzyme S subunit